MVLMIMIMRIDEKGAEKKIIENGTEDEMR